jgi:hypothetical protein
MKEASQKTPIHLWIVGLLAVLWNLVGAFDYAATQLQLESYMSQFTAEQLEYFYGFPTWVITAWAVAVWGSLLGSLSLLIRKSWAIWLFAAAVAGLAVTTIYNFVLTNGAEVMGEAGTIFTAVIWVIALLLLFYARAMDKKGVLH